jgi:[ribosomal protein S5]-alanine N-acetyltransferase
MTGSNPEIEFRPLSNAPRPELLGLLNDPRVTRHMPLATELFTPATLEQWVEGKDAQWSANGYGPWAVHVDGTFAGWGGFQKEGDDPDFALVLRPEFWGYGRAIYEAGMSKGFEDFGFESVIVRLPPSRRSYRVLSRLGFSPDGEAVQWGRRFMQFRLFK